MECELTVRTITVANTVI